MDYEKKYKLALANARQEYNTTENVERKQWLEELFPELKEIEDEKIRKKLISFVKNWEKGGIYSKYTSNTNDINKILAWLEKQKILTAEEDLQGKEDVLWCIKQAKKHAKDENEMGTCWFAEQWLEKQSESYTKRDVDNAYIEGMAFAKNELEKQGKPNPYSGTSFEYNGHIWGMCARDNGVEIIFDGELKAFLSSEKLFTHPQNYLKPKTVMEAIKEEKVDNANKIEPKFHKGEWIISSKGETAHIVEVRKDLYGTLRYYIEWANGSKSDPMPCFVDNDFHLWTIQDAKDGDVLVDVYGNIGVFQKKDDFDWTSYFSLGCYGGFQKFEVPHENDKTWPATKKQRDTLIKAITDAGYEWDADKKELSKIEPNNNN